MTKLWIRSGRRPTAGALHPKIERKSKGLLRGLLIGVLAVSLLGVPSVSFAGSKAGETSRESGLGAAAAISSLVYGPIKLVYALGGLVIGGFAWAFTAGDTEVASTVFTRSLRGTYVITPEILVGEEPLEFIGRDVPAEEPARTEAIAAADTSSVGYEEAGYDEMGW
jgi:hypothetical protein